MGTLMNVFDIHSEYTVKDLKGGVFLWEKHYSLSIDLCSQWYKKASHTVPDTDPMHKKYCRKEGKRREIARKAS